MHAHAANNEGVCSAPCTSPLYSWAHNGRDAAVTGGFVYHGTSFPASYQGSYFFADYGTAFVARLDLAFGVGAKAGLHVMGDQCADFDHFAASGGFGDCEKNSRHQMSPSIQAAKATTTSTVCDQYEPSLSLAIATSFWLVASRMRVATSALPARGPSVNLATSR